MREQDIERNLTRQVKQLGGLCLKFVSPGTAGVPDRLIILPSGRVVFFFVLLYKWFVHLKFELHYFCA